VAQKIPRYKKSNRKDSQKIFSTPLPNPETKKMADTVLDMAYLDPVSYAIKGKCVKQQPG